MGTAAELNLANQALRMLGEFSLSALDEGTEIAETVSLIQTDTLRFLLTMHPWRFTLRKARLARMADAPVNEWTYAHGLPAERLAIRAMWSAAGPGAALVREYELFESRVLSNHEDLWCDFQVYADPGAWPPYFFNLARHALAADFAVAVGAGPTLGNAFRVTAYGPPSDNMAGGLMGVARRLDSQQQPPQQITDSPLIAARQAGFPHRF